MGDEAPPAEEAPAEAAAEGDAAPAEGEEAAPAEAEAAAEGDAAPAEEAAADGNAAEAAAPEEEDPANEERRRKMQCQCNVSDTCYEYLIIDSHLSITRRLEH